MAAAIDTAALRAAVEFEVDRRKASASLYEFVKQAWHVVEPGATFVPSWHIEVICEHLEAITAGDIRQLLINIPPRHALSLDTPIPTTKGMIQLRALQPGDYVFGPDGQPVQVLGKSQIFNDRQVYRVTTDDGASVDVDADHVWTVRLDRKYGRYIDYTTEQLWQRQQGFKVRKLRSGDVEVKPGAMREYVRAPMLPSAQAVEYPERDLPIDPYVLGVWIGDGTSANGYITMHDDDIPEVRDEMQRRSWSVRSANHKYRHLVLGLHTKLRENDLLNNKHIPHAYLTASVAQRRALLRGLMDTDGNISKAGQCFFAQSNLALINQVAQLIRSLGIKANIIESEAAIGDKTYGKTWKISFYASDVAILSRKECRTLKNERTFGRYIRIEKLSSTTDMQCIKVDRPDGLFIAGDGYIVTHNSKSTIVSVMWPMWEWITDPSHQYLSASFSSTISIRDNLKARRLIQSPWYQERWGHLFQLAGDQNAKQRFENDHTGHRIATSVGGSTTGEGGSRLILDDPHGAQEAQSDAMRDSALEWFDAAWSTRLNNPKTDAMVVVMQRLHELDVSGHILNDLTGWEHICIPAEWDGVSRKTILGPYDPRTVKGELICPERFGAEEVEKLKRILGAYGASGQLQQDPTPAEGGILKTKYLNLWPADEPLPPFAYILQSYDCAFTEKSTGDPTACTVWGIFQHKGERNVMLIDAWDDHLGYPELRQKVINDWRLEYGGGGKSLHKGKRPDRLLVEAKASGQSLLQDLRLAKVPAVGYNPGNADKVARAHQAAPTLELGLVWVPESRKVPGQAVTWAASFMKQLTKFPVATHDDYVDTFTQAIIYLKNDGWFELPVAKDVDERKEYRKPFQNPYAI